MAADLESARLWRSPDSTRLVLDLSAAVDHQLIVLKNPDRLVIDISNINLKAAFDQLDLGKTPIAKIRFAVRNKTDLRVVLDLKSLVNPKSFSLKSNEEKGDRLVIDLFDKKLSVSRSVSDIIKTDNTKIVIAIDAGHGGEDPGAIGPKRVREKVVVLQIAQKLDALFDKSPYFQGELVRTGDYYIPLKKRSKIAHGKRADFFISIHADSVESPTAKGASIYTLSEKGNNSKLAQQLEQSQNLVDQFGGVETVIDNDQFLKNILTDFSRKDRDMQSFNLAKEIISQLEKIGPIHKKIPQKANFVVLKSPAIPSVLVETAFISNPTQEKRLTNSKQQQKIADLIYQGIINYYRKLE